jgi:hypothetical protein
MTRIFIAVAAACMNQASDKHLAGEALTSFMDKCEHECTSRTTSADDRKLSGATRKSFTKKCFTTQSAASRLLL